MVRLQDPKSQIIRLFPPGGKIEKGETPEAAAVRETKEETGYDIVVDTKTEFVARYPFVWDEQTFACTTHFFRGTLVNPQAKPSPVRDAPYNLGAEWIPCEDVPDKLRFDENIRDSVLRTFSSRPRL